MTNNTAVALDIVDFKAFDETTQEANTHSLQSDTMNMLQSTPTNMFTSQGEPSSLHSADMLRGCLTVALTSQG